MKATVTLGATAAQVAELASTMRAECLRDCLAAGYQSGLAALEAGVRQAVRVVVVTLGGEVGAMAGACPDGAVWVLTSDIVLAHPLAFARASRSAARLLVEGHAPLHNFVDGRFVECVRWLQWLGAEVGAPVRRNGASCLPVVLREGPHVRTSRG
jgi:hypothetical protein